MPLVWLVVTLPLVTPCLPFTGSSTSCRNATSRRAPCIPLVRLVVMLPLVTPAPPVHQRLHLLSGEGSGVGNDISEGNGGGGGGGNGISV
jgi:hypothetical protein